MQNNLKRKRIAVGIILLFVGTCMIPTIAQNTEKSLPTTRGDWLYVGGSGPGNYSKIQDAIDDASDGDTVFVYSGSYVETLVIEKSITLTGEEKHTTILEGKNASGYLVSIKDAKGVTICSFTFNNSYHGISLVTADFSSITDCIILSSNITKIDYGIYCETSKNVTIGMNDIINFSYTGICLARCSHCLVSQNKIMNCALYTTGTGMFNQYTYNTITNTTNAVVLDDFFSLVEGNTIKNNGRGMLLIEGFGNKIVKNNFISNDNFNAVIQSQFLIKTLLECNKWGRNYWDDVQGIVKFIPCYYLTPGYPSKEIYLPYSLNIDWHPAQEPYDIQVRE